MAILLAHTKEMRCLTVLSQCKYPISCLRFTAMINSVSVNSQNFNNAFLLSAFKYNILGLEQTSNTIFKSKSLKLCTFQSRVDQINPWLIKL